MIRTFSSSFGGRKRQRRTSSSSLPSSSFSRHALERVDPNNVAPSSQLASPNHSKKKKIRMAQAVPIPPDLSFPILTATSNATHSQDLTLLQDTNAKGEDEKDWKSVQKELDDLFVKQSDERMNQVPAIKMPGLFEENNVKLLPHQIDGIRWLVHKEVTNTSIPPYYKLRTSGTSSSRKYSCSLDGMTWRGAQNQTPPPLRHSILADDMGLGKTLQSIGLILSNPPKDADGKPQEYPYEMPRKRQGDGALPPRCTIVVAPVSVMSNWKMEIDKFVHEQKKNILKVELYQGPKRVETLRKVRDGKLDILICSYQTLASDFKKQQALEEEAAELAKEDKKKTASKTESEASDSEEEEIDVDINCASDKQCYLGQERSRLRPKRKRIGYVDTDEGSSDDPHGDDSFEEENYVDDSDDEEYFPDYDGEEVLDDIPTIFHQHFHRIILDEAHTIRNAKTNYFQSVKALNATHKLCITGTPFVNHPRDIYSFLDFLEVEPLNDIHKFNARVVQPIEERKEVGLARLRVLMGALAIRRTKNEIDGSVQLTKKDLQIREISFDGYDEHKHINEMMYHTCRTAFLSLSRISEKKDRQSAKELFGLVLRVRQSCCDASLVPPEVRETVTELWEEFKKIRHSEDLTVGKGQELFDKLVEALKLAKNRIELASKELEDGDVPSASGRGHRSRTTKEYSPQLGRSPKVQALLDAITEMKNDEKGVIFSQWTKFLDIIEQGLREEGHTFVRLDGSMNADERGLAMRKFASKGCDSLETPRFILCSLKACGSGITLTRANHIFMMDTWWNVAEENQAMDRVHRIGQTRPVRAIRFIMENSIEQRFINVQDSKQALGKGSMERLKKEDRKKANITALKDLFEMEVKEHEWEGTNFVDDDADDSIDDGADLKDFIVSDDDSE